ncbi:MAG: glycoside hydrolase/phage tail family protein [Paracoccaceae bacterium]
MATLLLSAAGGAIGAGFGGSVLGLSGAVIGRAVGATVGRAIDQSLLGAGGRAVETGRVDRFRLTGASEGAAIGQIWGRLRVAGQVIWSSRFQEHVSRTGGGKGSPKPTVTEYSYSVSLAVALCEGEITRVGRIWADGSELGTAGLNLRVYSGTETQLPDPKISAVEGDGNAPAYRGVAYVLIEDLDLGAFGNRVPQFSFEVVRPAQGQDADIVPDLTEGIRAIALIPGTGEYALATTPVHFNHGPGVNVSANVHRPGGGTDFSVSLKALEEELPNCDAVSLVVAWFGDDLRCGQCTIRPKAEAQSGDGVGMAWRSGGIGRTAAQVVAQIAGRPAYGGTPADASVIEAIGALNASGKAVTYYPFILMDQLVGNGKPDPWAVGADQPQFPWRGRITCSVAPGLAGSPDRSVSAAAEVAAFFGVAAPGDFQLSGTTVSYAGPNEWSYRRFVLHQAMLCKAAGGVSAFCIGSEMRGLTSVRGAGDSFPSVAALRQLAADVRTILGPGVKIGYAADWSEYFGYQDGQGSVYFHLDPLWADANIDFVGIDNYMPVSDWRDGDSHADAGWGSIYSIGYLQAGIEGGEGFDWYYQHPAHRAAQIRTPITDGDYGEPWVWRFKDIRSWWSNPHHERLAGVRQAVPTAWVPQSKPVWFTEFGCPAVDKGSNEPNKFVDLKSSESGLPYASDGRRDDLIQMQYLRAVTSYWADPARNPVSTVYDGPMIDMARAHVWAWDMRPFPEFPGDAKSWSDAANYGRGHWVSGRTTAQPVAKVVAEIAGKSGLGEVDVSEIYGLVRGYSVADVTTGRAALQPLMLAYGFDAMERDGLVRFRMRGLGTATELNTGLLAVDEATDGLLELARAGLEDAVGRVRLGYIEAEGDFAIRAAEATDAESDIAAASMAEMALSLIPSEAQGIAERWLAEGRVAKDTARFALPPSYGWLGAGDKVRFDAESGAAVYRIDRVERTESLAFEAVRFEKAVHTASDESEQRSAPKGFVAPVPVEAVFLDLPLMTGQESPYAPHVAVAAVPWPGTVAVYVSDSDVAYTLNRTIAAPAVVGVTETVLDPAQPGVWDRGPALRVRFSSGGPASADATRLLNGANLLAVGDGSSDRWELLQFRDAVLVAPGTFDLSLRLRGQAGTEAVAPGGWPVGSVAVLMDGAPRQIGLTLAEKDLARHYRIGPSRLDPADAAFVHRVEAFAAIGLRPYAPAHLKASRAAGGAVIIDWVRRTRIGGDSWSGLDVPLGEAAEAYLVRVRGPGGAILRQVTVAQPTWSYPPYEQAADGVSAPFDIDVAQLSDSFGPGPFERITIHV